MAFVHIQHPWTFTFGILGNIISFLVYLAPVTTFYRVYRKKSTEGFHSVPYVVALFSSMLWLYYALLKTNAMLLITINSFGCVVEIIYIIIYLIYAPTHARKLTMKLFGVMDVGMFSLIVIITQFAVTHPYQVQALGWICVAVSVTVFAAPLSIVAQVIKTRSVEFMPFTLSFFLTLSAIMWFAYGLFLKDICIALPNILGFVLGLIQMLLYAIYKNCAKKSVIVDIEDQEEKLPHNHDDHHLKTNNIHVAASDQVHPLDAKTDGHDDESLDERPEDQHDHHQRTMEIALCDLNHNETPV